MTEALHLQNANGESLILWVDGYEFPHLQDNWLNIGIEVKLSEGSWAKIFPCMETVELDYLIRWFTAIGAGQNKRDWFRFTEPNLGFDFDGTFPGNLKINFTAEYRPSWTTSYYDETSFNIYLDQRILLQIIDALENMSAEFPTRSDNR